jgi:Sulfatase
LPVRRAEPGFLRLALTHGARLAVLSAFALAQPLLDILGKNPEFFTARRSSSSEIVLFALFLVFVPPAVLLAVELLVRLASRPAGEAVHLVFVAGLVAVVVLHALTNRASLSGALPLVVAGAVGALGALLYLRAAPVGSFLTVLAPAPLVFLALFLFDSPASKLVFVKHPHVNEARVRSDTPVVLVVFDEFAPVALMNREERVDAERYPNFAALARDSTWYRSATTVQWLTEQAVPAVLTGILPPENRTLLPIYADHPHNVFTLLGGSYRVRAVESLTQLCPQKICRERRGASPAAVPDTTGSLASDAGIVYLHLLLPEPYSERVPAISDSWGNFGQREARPVTRPSATGTLEPCGRNVCRFASLFSGDHRPTLYVLHSLLPHVPYLYLPSGRRYGVQAPAVRGIRDGVFKEAWPAEQGYQRFLLQTEYTDRALGFLLRRLKAKGIYDRALVIVTADHGVSYRNGEPRRRPTPGNLQDIAFVPLFVKLPGQHRARIDDGFAQTIDVVPTIAHVLGARLPWHMDGRPLDGRRLAVDGTVSVRLGDGTAESARLSDLRARRARALGEQLARFGSTRRSVYGIGPERGLIGKSLAQLQVEPSQDAGVELDGQALFGFVDRRTDFLPVWVQGRLTGRHGQHEELAIAVDGRVVATTWSFEGVDGTGFDAMVPEQALRNGRNDVVVLRVRHEGGTVRLQELRGTTVTVSLVRSAGREEIRASDGTVVPVRPGALRGFVQVATGPLVRFAGWAALASLAHRADSLVVIADGHQVFASPTAQLRPHRLLGYHLNVGFQFELPQGLLPPAGTGHDVRVYAVGGGFASELRVKGPWPWR